MLGLVVFVRTYVSEERISSVIRVTRIGELGTALEVSRNRSGFLFETTMMEAIRSCETSVHIKATHRNIPEDGIFRKLYGVECIM
jgi:hypothetical protein